MWCTKLNPQNNDARVNLTVYIDRKQLSSEMDLFSANVIITCFNISFVLTWNLLRFFADSFRVVFLLGD